MSGSNQEHPVVLYDGVCALCNYWVRFILKHDRAGKIHFAALQSEHGAAMLRGAGIDPHMLSSIVFVTSEGAYLRSDAVLEIFRELPLPWSFLNIFRFIPRALRDFAYDLVARFRYRVFGKYDSCPLPPPEAQNRFRTG